MYYVTTTKVLFYDSAFVSMKKLKKH